MAIVSWNVRGLNREEAMKQVKLLVKYHKPDLLFMIETKLPEDKINFVKSRLGFEHGFEVPRVGLGGGLMALWKDEVEVTILTSSPNHFSCFLRLDKQQWPWHFCGFYGDPRVANRHTTWELLQKLRIVTNGPWLVMGDFNEILGQEDKDGGEVKSETQIEAFRTSLEVCALQPLDYRGDHFTWLRKTTEVCIRERLDWAMANEEWMECFQNNYLAHLDFFHSDHRALYLNIQNSSDMHHHITRKRSRFRFENMWIREPDCREIITSSWQSTNQQDTLLSVIDNIKQCSINLANWNQSKFGSLAREIKKTHEQLIQLHNVQDQLGNNRELKAKEQSLNELLYKEEIFWKQRSRILWLEAGDRNTKFFHQRATKRIKTNVIKGLLNEENVWCPNETDCSEIIQRFYQDLFTSIYPAEEKVDELLTAVRPLVTDEMNTSLERAFTMQEIKNAMFSISPDKSPGQDGMNAMFYQQHWDIVGPLVSKAIMDCLNGNEELERINTTLVTLIPKVKEPTSVGDYRPISLCNVLYKVISKVLINRFKPILPVIISGTQSAFVPGRLITDNALIAYECLHHLRLMKEGKRSYVAMKLDMSKAYDRVEWIFIEKMLIKMGFSLQWVNKTMRCVNSVSYSFQINGKTYGEIRPSRGLRQGDPLSPYLFLICAEGFSSLLQQAESRRDIMGLKIARTAPCISHLFFADDSLLFIKASTRSIQAIQNIFSLYSQCSGQVINFNKSILFFSPNMEDGIRSIFTTSLSMQTTDAIETYLGLPMMGGKNKKAMFRSMKDRVWVKLHSWRPDLFSQAGKEILLKSVIQAMPTYLMSCFRIPEGQCEELEKLMARFWWGSVQPKRKIHWRAWKDVCVPKSEGGLGFRKFGQYNQALLAKQAWRILINPLSLIAQVLQARYFTQSGFLDAREGNSPSLTWRSICWGKSLLVKGLRRRIGDGQNTNAFKDAWIPRPSSFLPITKGVNDNVKVADLIQYPGKWNRELIDQCFLAPDAQLISTIPLSPFNHPDSWLWHYNKNGIYSVKSGYHLALTADRAETSSSSEEISAWWRAFWSTKIPRKMLTFGWRGFHEILPTTKGLHRRKVVSHSACPICGFGEDSNAHAVFWCPFAQEVWVRFDYPFMVGAKEDISFKGVLFYATECLESNEIDKLLIIAWGIWTERNKKTHGQQHRAPEQIKIWLSSYYEEIKDVREKICDFPNREELAHGDHMEVETRDLSLFVDAAICINTQMVGLGAAIVTANKKTIAALSKPLSGSLSVFHAEALALLVGLRWVQEVGLPIKRILSDSLALVQALNNAKVYQNEMGIILADIRMIMSHFPEASISHVSRNFNVIAHNLSKQALRLEDELSWVEGIPQGPENSE